MDSGQSVALVIGDAESLQHKLQLCVVRNLFLVIMIMILSISKNGAQTRVDVMGFEPMAFCMQSRRDTTTPYARMRDASGQIPKSQWISRVMQGVSQHHES